MIKVRKSADRGHFNHGWLDTYHTFSFADYYDPTQTGFRDLRVINEDVVAPGEGFGEHGHRDMEIVTYMLDGELAHQDSMGNGAVLRPGDVQWMSAGSGVQHSEFNHSKENAVKLLQIWIKPEAKNLKPGYEDRSFAREGKLNRLQLLVSPDGAEHSLKLHQDARVYASILEPGQSIQMPFRKNRYAWIQVARGCVKINENVNEVALSNGDGAAIEETETLGFSVPSSSIEPAEFLVFDLK